jgi:hypothetical protein
MQLCLNNRQPASGCQVNAQVGAFAQRDQLELSARLTLFADLSDWVPPSTLRDWIEQEIERLNWDLPRIQEFPRPRLDYQTKMLLCLLSFAYATGVFCHEEVVARCHSDDMLRLICVGSVPSVQELSYFRRRNRALLERILAGVFLQAVRYMFDLDAVWLSPPLAQDLSKHAAERLDLARHMDTDE